jgi:hypothetical protein
MVSSNWNAETSITAGVYITTIAPAVARRSSHGTVRAPIDTVMDDAIKIHMCIFVAVRVLRGRKTDMRFVFQGKEGGAHSLARETVN